MSAYNQIVVDKHKYKNNKYFKKGEVCDISLNQMSGKFIQTVNRKTLIWCRKVIIFVAFYYKWVK